jgi:dockerin type I repeat protein
MNDVRVLRSLPGICFAFSLAFFFAHVASGQETEFLRGDVNGDGVVTVSDSQGIYNYAVLGGDPPQCLKAADANDDGEVDISDISHIADSTIHLRLIPCPPFPDKGLDPTPDFLTCESYGGGSPLEDPEALIEIEVEPVNTEAADQDAYSSLRVLVSSSRRVTGVQLELAAGGLFASHDGLVAYRYIDLRPTNAAGRQRQHRFLYGILFGQYFDDGVGPGSDIPILELHPCLEEGVPAGEYPLEVLSAEIIDGETGRAIRPRTSVVGSFVLEQPVPVELGCPPNGGSDLTFNCKYSPWDPPPEPAPPGVDFLRGDFNADGRLSISDSLALRRYIFHGGQPFSCEESGDVDASGELDVTDVVRGLNALFLGGPSPAAPFPDVGPGSATDPLGCEAYEVQAPVVSSDVIDIGEAIAAPGQIVEIPVLITNEVEIEAVQLLLAYDDSLLEPLGMSFTGSYFEAVEDAASFRAVQSIEAGILAVGFIPELIEDDHAIPPGEGRLVFSILARVSEDAVPGTVIDLIPTNGPDGQGIGIARMRNELTYRGGARFLSNLPETLPGHLQIVGDLAVFVRGDSNSDGAVNISDATHTLGYLFTGEATIDCEDAADSNDDGTVNISDPIATLGYLFLGVGFLPPPSSSPGVDPTGDELGCRE